MLYTSNSYSGKDTWSKWHLASALGANALAGAGHVASAFEAEMLRESAQAADTVLSAVTQHRGSITAVIAHGNTDIVRAAALGPAIGQTVELDDVFVAGGAAADAGFEESECGSIVHKGLEFEGVDPTALPAIRIENCGMRQDEEQDKGKNGFNHDWNADGRLKDEMGYL